MKECVEYQAWHEKCCATNALYYDEKITTPYHAMPWRYGDDDLDMTCLHGFCFHLIYDLTLYLVWKEWIQYIWISDFNSLFNEDAIEFVVFLNNRHWIRLRHNKRLVWLLFNNQDVFKNNYKYFIKKNNLWLLSMNLKTVAVL